MKSAVMVLAALALGLWVCGCGSDGPVLCDKHDTAIGVTPNSDTVVPLTKTPVIIIDARSPREYADGHLEGALLMPHDVIGGLIEARVPDKSTPILLYCRSGGRSEMARKTLVSLNYTSVENLGGMQAAAGKLKKKVVK